MDINLVEFLPADLLIVALVVYLIGMILKKVEFIKDCYIPLILLVVAIIITIVFSAISLGYGFTPKTITDGIVYGIIVASAAVFCNQMLKQLLTERKRE